VCDSETFWVAGTAPGTRTFINAGSGAANVIVTAKGVVRPLRISGGLYPTGVLSVPLDDSGGAADRVTITPTQVGAAAGDNFFGPAAR
jgi:hypothetical protein